MTTLITGGTGFIGAEVVRMLLARGEQRPVVFHVSGNTQRLDDVADQVELVRGDLANFSHILDVVKKVHGHLLQTQVRPGFPLCALSVYRRTWRQNARGGAVYLLGDRGMCQREAFHDLGSA